MKLEGYTVSDIKPWETASGGKAVTCPLPKCTAELRYGGPSGWYELRVQYFDLSGAGSRFRLWVGTQLVDEWSASDHLPARKLDSSSSTLPPVSSSRGFWCGSPLFCPFSPLLPPAPLQTYRPMSSCGQSSRRKLGYRRTLERHSVFA